LAEYRAKQHAAVKPQAYQHAAPARSSNPPIPNVGGARTGKGKGYQGYGKVCEGPV
jgi:hypothetical protein